MQKQSILIGITTVFFASGFLPAGYVNAESASRVTAAEERATAAREQADLARQNAERAAEEANIAEEQAARARLKTPSARRAELERELAELNAHETERGLVLTLGDVLFATDQAELTPNAMRKLYPLSTLLK